MVPEVQKNNKDTRESLQENIMAPRTRKMVTEKGLK